MDQWVSIEAVTDFFLVVMFDVLKVLGVALIVVTNESRMRARLETSGDVQTVWE